MQIAFQDSDIDRLVRMLKPLPENWRTRLHNLRPIHELSQKRASLIVNTNEGSFRIMVRQSTINPLDFSVILGFRRPREAHWFRLRRYNGLHPGEHRNRLERASTTEGRSGMRGFHIHVATARYQERGLQEDGYAIGTEKYGNVESAIQLMISECGFQMPPERPENLAQGEFWPKR